MCLYKNLVVGTEVFRSVLHVTEKCPVYLRVAWIGKPSTNLEKKDKTAVESCYGSVSTRLVFTSKRMLPVSRKDVLPTIQKSFVYVNASATVIVAT